MAGLVVSPGRLPGATAAAWLATWGWTPELVVVVFLPLLFPGGTLPSPRWRPFARVAAGCCALLVLAAMVSPAPIDASGSVSNPAGTVRVFAVIVVVMVAVIGLILTPVALGLRQRRATAFTSRPGGRSGRPSRGAAALCPLPGGADRALPGPGRRGG